MRSQVRFFMDAADERRFVDAIIEEQIASPEAMKLLTSIAGGEPSARLTREAAASLERIRNR